MKPRTLNFGSIAFVLLGLSLPISSAAQYSELTNSNQTITPLDLSNANTITFSSGLLKVNTTDCQNQYFGLAVSEVINFDVVASVENLNKPSALAEAFPNPAENEFVLTVDATQVNQQATIWSASGVCVKQWNVTSKVSSVNVEELAAGMYIVRIGNSNFKLIKR